MDDGGLARSVDAALLPMLLALAPWGVTDIHWLPDRRGAPVVWLRTTSEEQRAALEAQAWVLPQVQVTLTRLGLPHDVTWRLRMEVTSVEAEARLFESD